MGLESLAPWSSIIKVRSAKLIRQSYTKFHKAYLKNSTRFCLRSIGYSREVSLNEIRSYN